MGKVIKGGILGGIILFVWCLISWLVLPWHQSTIHQFNVEKAVSQSIQSNAPLSGIYFFPSVRYQAEAANGNTPAPMIFAAVTLQGSQPMASSLIISFITQVVAAFFVAWMLIQAQGLGYFGRLWFVILFALAAGTITEVPYWNWFGFDLQFTLIQFADLIIGWFFAGLALAKICKR